MTEHAFQARCNSLRLRYRRSLIAAKRKRLANLRALQKITGIEQLIPAGLTHLETARA